MCQPARVKAYTAAVHKVARVSKIMAMALPHSIFLGLCVAFRVACPAVVQWLVHDTYVTVILSVGYPFLATLGVVHGQRHPPTGSNSNHDNIKKEDSIFGAASALQVRGDSARSLDPSSVCKGQIDTNLHSATSLPRGSLRPRGKDTADPDSMVQYAQQSASRKRRSGGVNSSSPASYSRSNLASTKLGSEMTSAPVDAESSTTYWLRYWAVHALVQAFGQFCYLVPIFGRIVSRNPILHSVAAELKLLFFLWLFGMERMLGTTAKDAFLAEALPLRLIQRKIIPLVLRLQSMISEAIPPATWQSMIVSKARGLLEVLVMVRMLSEEGKDWLVQVLDEARVLVLPSVTLLMPGFITQFGVAYVQFVVPSAKSSQARGDSMKLLYLEYWLLHLMVAGLLTWFSGILWWVPLSTHLIYLLWCYLVLPPTIREWYGVLESELVAFGLLKGSGRGSSVAVNKTKTARLLNSLVSRLPSATSDDKRDPGDDMAGDENHKNNRASGQDDDEESVTAGSTGPLLSGTAIAMNADNEDDDDDDDSIPGLAAKTSGTLEDDSDDECASSSHAPAIRRTADIAPPRSVRTRNTRKNKANETKTVVKSKLTTRDKHS
jgi:hypothetical protein